MGTSQKLSLTVFRELYGRMEGEGSSSQALLEVAKRIADAEVYRDRLLRERRERRAATKKKALRGDSLSDLIQSA